MSYYVTVSQIGNIDHGATICGYLGLILMSAAYIGIGLFASSITNNQIVAFLLALLIGVFFHFIFDMMSYGASGLFGQILSVLSVNRHFDSLAQGVLDTKDLLFFISLTLAGLYLSELYISKRAK